MLYSYVQMDVLELQAVVTVTLIIPYYSPPSDLRNIHSLPLFKAQLFKTALSL